MLSSAFYFCSWSNRHSHWGCFVHYESFLFNFWDILFIFGFHQLYFYMCVRVCGPYMYVKHKESRVLKNWCFWSVMLEKILESSLDYEEIKPINPEYSLEGLMLKLKLRYFGHLMRRPDSLEKTLMLGNIESRRRRGRDGWIPSPTQLMWVWAAPRVGDRQGSPVCWSPWACKEWNMTGWLNWLTFICIGGNLHSQFWKLLIF